VSTEKSGYLVLMEPFMNFRRITIYIASILVVVLINSCSDNTTTVATDPFEGGKLYKSSSGTFLVPVLSGSFKEMGRQYGLMLQDQIKEFYKVAVDDYLIAEKGIKYEDLVESGLSCYSNFSALLRDYLDGMAETNGLGKEKTYILSEALPAIGFAGCSSLSAWDAYTTDGKTITGRNLDLPFPHLRRFSKYFNIIVWNPKELPASVASIDYIGGLFYQTAINSKGIFLELQNGQNADTCNPPGRQNTNNILLESLFMNVNSNEYDQWFETVLPEAGLIMNGSYPNHATIYEWATFRVAIRNGNGILSASNDFIDSSWVNYPIFFYDSTNEGIGKTWTRRTNLLNLGEQYKGEINPARMMEILDTDIPNGGATFPESGFIKTIYSVVAKPSELKIWLKVHEYSDWEEIDLKQIFTNQ